MTQKNHAQKAMHTVAHVFLQPKTSQTINDITPTGWAVYR